MADNYLITGYHGTPHVTAENDRGINAGICGTGRFVLPVGQQFKAEYIGNNTVRMYDGKLIDNGAAAGIPAGEYVDLLIAGAGQGLRRNDLIVFQYTMDASTLIESGAFVVIQGEETSGTPSDPVLAQEDLLSGSATYDQMALWRVSVNGATISAPVQVFELYEGNGGVKVATGSYKGTGLCGSSNPNSLTFDFVPKIVVIGWIAIPYGIPSGIVPVSVSGGSLSGAWIQFEWSGNTLTWHSTTASGQLNESAEYNWAAIG